MLAHGKDGYEVIHIDDDVASCATRVISAESACIEWGATATRSIEIAAMEIQKLVDLRSGEKDRQALAAHWQRGYRS